MRTRRRLRPPHWPRFDQAVTRPLEFGIFDWLEYQPDVALADTFEDRLRMLELADELGFYAYHLAQHEGTPLSLSGSPFGGDRVGYSTHAAPAPGTNHLLSALAQPASAV